MDPLLGCRTHTNTKFCCGSCSNSPALQRPFVSPSTALLKQKILSTAKAAASKNTTKRKRSQKRLYLFPEKLFRIVENPEHKDIICWEWVKGKGDDAGADICTDFLIHDPEKFEATILKTEFNGVSFRAFQRQLANWCFSRTSNHGQKLNLTYTHPLFRPGNLKSVHSIVRGNTNFQKPRKQGSSKSAIHNRKKKEEDAAASMSLKPSDEEVRDVLKFMQQEIANDQSTDEDPTNYISGGESSHNDIQPAQDGSEEERDSSKRKAQTNMPTAQAAKRRGKGFSFSSSSNEGTSVRQSETQQGEALSLHKKVPVEQFEDAEEAFIRAEAGSKDDMASPQAATTLQSDDSHQEPLPYTVQQKENSNPLEVSPESSRLPSRTSRRSELVDSRQFVKSLIYQVNRFVASRNYIDTPNTPAAVHFRASLESIHSTLRNADLELVRLELEEQAAVDLRSSTVSTFGTHVSTGDLVEQPRIANRNQDGQSAASTLLMLQNRKEGNSSNDNETDDDGDDGPVPAPW